MMKKYDSIFEMFEDILGKEKITLHKRRISKLQKLRNLDLQKAIYEYIKQIDEAFEATKNSNLQFD